MPEKDPQTGNIEPTLDEIEQEEADKEHHEIDRLIGQYAGQGYTVEIRRLVPRWCQGYCDEWPLDESFSIADVKDQCGGRRFTFKVKRADGHYIKSFSAWIDDEPRRHGRPIRLGTADYVDDRAPLVLEQNGGGNSDALKVMQQMHNQQMDFMQQMIAMKAEAAPPTNPAAQLTQTIELMRGLRDVASEFSPQEGGFGVGGTEIAKMFFEMMQQRKAAPQQQTAQPRPAPVGPPRPLAQTPAQRPAQARPMTPPHARPFVHDGPPAPPMEQSAAPQEDAEIDDIENDEPLTPEELSSELAEDLATLDPEHAADAFKKFLDRVPQEHARRVIEKIVGVPIDVDTMSALVQNPAHGGNVGSDNGP